MVILSKANALTKAGKVRKGVTKHEVKTKTGKTRIMYTMPTKGIKKKIEKASKKEAKAKKAAKAEEAVKAKKGGKKGGKKGDKKASKKVTKKSKDMPKVNTKDEESEELIDIE